MPTKRSSSIERRAAGPLLQRVAADAEHLGEAAADAALGQLLLRGAHAVGAEQHADDARLVAGVAAHHDVLQRRHLREEPDVLERARDAEVVDLVRLGAGDLLALEPDLALGRGVDAGHRVEAGRLAGAVGADQAEDLAAADLEVDVVEGHDAAEAQRDVVDLEQGLAHLAGRLDRDQVVVGGVLEHLGRVGALGACVCSDIGRSLLGLVSSILELPGPSSAGHQALRAQDHHQHQRDAEGERAPVDEARGTARAGR